MRVRRRPATDALTRDGETVLLFASKVVRLSAMGAAIYDIAQEPVTVEALVDELELRFGTPTDQSVGDITQRAVSDLLRLGVLYRHV
ncbi:PqqD family peptide modification chaperone [Knoellia sp. CPCC 206435]|uniref:PqqD family peptide modification chaperone n=1 Tax=Knoellia terrae TaxID=3404797 RepID=UPI003B4293F8